jgi:S-adenosylmethionine:tRNA ribosyltransferase-isomerase
MRVDQFDFELPEERIALRPARPRDHARLLVIKPEEGFFDNIISNLPDFLEPGDAIVLNDTRVIPAQLEGSRNRDGNIARIGLTLHQRVAPDKWLAFARGKKKLRSGDRLHFASQENQACVTRALDAIIAEIRDDGEILVQFDMAGTSLDEAVGQIGHLPLPPYIASRRREDVRDREDYQTVYARHEGAVAAPTAGLHFTEDLFRNLAAKGIACHYVTLHVGAGTFLPVKSENTRQHKMHSETGTISAQTAAALNAVRANGGRIVSIGTTSLRLLESAADRDGVIHPWCGATDIFITPGYRFRAVDALLTNFHLPRSTLFMLVCAFCGMETMQQAYSHAIEEQYRFYSYGDASLLFPAK